MSYTEVGPVRREHVLGGCPFPFAEGQQYSSLFLLLFLIFVRNLKLALLLPFTAELT